jgi:peptide chain release factor subunit 1
MLTEQSLAELIAYRPKQEVLSVYLNVDPSTGSADTYRLHLRQLLKEFEDRAAQDTEAILRFIQYEYDWQGRGLAIFSNAADNFFRSFPLTLPVRSRARLLNRPYVKPLADLMENYGHFGVAVVDKQGARLFHFHIGELQEQEGVLGEVVRHTKRGGGSQAAGRRGGIAGQTRYSEEVADRNLKEAARFATQFFQEKRIRRVLIGGTETNVTQFIEALPKTFQSLVMGTFSIDMTAGHAQIYEKALDVAKRAQEERLKRLVESIITAAAKGQEGVIRLDDTLSAVHAGNVQTLVISEGYRAPGYRCEVCEYISAQSLEQCPFCGNAIVEIEDAIEFAVRRVLSNGGEVEVVHGDRRLDRAGRIGGLLRY